MGCTARGAADPRVSHSGRGVKEALQARGGAEVSRGCAEVSWVLKWGWRPL